MSDNLKKVPLTDSQVERIAGGNLHYINDTDCKLLWSDENSDVQYTFSDMGQVMGHLFYNCWKKPDAESIESLLAAGVIWPIE